MAEKSNSVFLKNKKFWSSQTCLAFGSSFIANIHILIKYSILYKENNEYWRSCGVTFQYFLRDQTGFPQTFQPPTPPIDRHKSVNWE